MWPNNFQMIHLSHDFMILPDLDCWTPVNAGPKLWTIPPLSEANYTRTAHGLWIRTKFEPRFVPAMKFLNFDSGTVMLYVKQSPLAQLAKQDTARWRISGWLLLVRPV